MLKYLIALLVLLNGADAALTNHIVAEGVGREGNPILVGVVGGPWFIVLKMAAVLLCGVIIWDISLRHPRLAWVATCCLVGAYSGIVLWNFSLLVG